MCTIIFVLYIMFTNASADNNWIYTCSLYYYVNKL